MIRLSGRFRSALIIGLQGIRARKLRTLLSMVSLFLGVLAVVVVQAGAETAKRAALADIELHQGKDGTRQMYLPPSGRNVPIAVDTLTGRSDGVATITTQAIIGEPDVTPVNAGGVPFDQAGGGGGPVFYGPNGGFMKCDQNGVCYGAPGADQQAAPPPPGQAVELSLTAMTGDIRPYRPYRLESGQWLDFASAPSLAPRIVINREAAKGFSRYRVPAQMRITGATDSTPRIIGVVDDGNDQPSAYVRTDELLNWLPAAQLTGNGGGIQVLLSPTATDLEQILRARLVAGGLSAGDIHVDTVNSKKQIESQLAIVRLIFLGMAGLVLLIGVAGILNVGLATVGERVEEFALRRAVGTPRSLLAGIVLAETLLTGLLTAGAAIAVASQTLRFVGTVYGGRQPFLQHLTFPWQAGAAGVVAGLVAGLLGGLIPAIRAARIPIATVMRA